MAVSQIDLVRVLLKFLGRRKVPVNTRQMNAVIEAATLVADALDRPHAPATPGMGLPAWLACDETGQSSLYLAHVLAPRAGLGYVPAPKRRFGEHHPHPRDPSDFGRCVGLLDAVPAFRPLLGWMADGHGRVWAALAGTWPELEALYREELPAGVAPRLAARLLELTADPPADPAATGGG